MKKILIHTTEMLEELSKNNFSANAIESFDMYCLGYPTREIADNLGISPKTVEYHLAKTNKFLNENYDGNMPHKI